MLRRVLAEALFTRGRAALEANCARQALRRLAWSVRFAPSTTRFLKAAASAAARAGERDRAVGYCERALALDPELDEVHQLLIDMFLHGEHYFEILRRIHPHLAPRSYIEIGVRTGDSLALVQPGTLALGVDPEAAIAWPLPPNVRVFAETSDEFFARRDVRAELGGLPVDLAFIDGMHHFEYAVRDFMNLERLCRRESTILVHDCFPHDRRTAERERQAHFWSGDVWRFVLLLKKYRGDLRIHTIATPPTGLVVIRNLNPESRYIPDNLERLCEEYMALDYSHLIRDRAGKLNLFPNDWSRIRELLDAAVT